jgi:ATP/maltotriose-dependent transcriptional regulator MalT
VSAPAGFGKTTLLAQWLPAAAADGRFVAWLSLDHRDNDPASFWTYVAGALRTTAEGIGANALSLLQRPEPPSEAGLAHLLNDLDSISNDVVLVLDDYHVIDARDVQDGMGFLLEHLPPQIHLVIASRAGPLLIAAVIATLFGGIEQYSSLAALAALPVAAWELSLGVWLVVKGFKPSPITTGMTTADTAPAYHDVTA